MGRSVKKGPFIAPKLLKKIQVQTAASMHEPIKTWSRGSVVSPEFVNHTFLVHNGRTFIRVFVTEDMVGHKLGEFAPTRTFRGHTNRKQAVKRSGK